MPESLETHTGCAVVPDAWSQRVSASLSKVLAGAGVTPAPSMFAMRYEFGSLPGFAKARMKRWSGATAAGSR